ncbi:hypothetical protein ACJQWK_05778 [Exserohilum turcicum]
MTHKQYSEPPCDAPFEANNHKPHNQFSSFLDLPAELRNSIYELVLHEGTFDVFPNQHSPKPQTLSLLSTCTQIRYEALPIFYSRNTFDFAFMVTHIPKFVRMFGLFA